MFLDWLKQESVTITHALQAVVVVLGAFSFGLGHDQEAALITIASALVTLITVLTTRPISVAGLKGVATTILTAAVAFGLPLDPKQIAAIVAAGYIAFGYLLRSNVSPKAGPLNAAPASSYAVRR